MRYLIAILCALALVAAQALYAGVLRPVFALPCYLLVGSAGVLSLALVFRRDVPLPSLICVLSTFAFAGWLLWRSENSPDAWLAGSYTRLILACLTMYAIFAFAITTPRSRMTFVGILLVAAAIQAAFGAWQFVNRHDTMPLPWMSEYFRDVYASRLHSRAHGFYLNANHLAWFLNAAWAFALPIAIWSRFGIKTKLITFYFALMSLIGSLLTLSRGGVISLVFGLVVFLFLSAYMLLVGARGRRPLAVIVLALGIAVCAGVAFYVFNNSFTVQDRYLRLFEDHFRPLAFNAVSRQFQLEPVFGTGAGTFLYYGRQFRENVSFHDDVFAHNDWMQLAGDFGFPAVALLVIVLLLHFGQGVQNFVYIIKKRMFTGSRPQSDAAALLMAALIVVSMFILHSFFDFNMQLPANALLAAACLGIIANGGMEGEFRMYRWVKMALRWVIGLLIGAFSAALLFVTIKVAPGEISWLRSENALYGREWDVAVEYGLEGIAANPRHPKLYRAVGEGYMGIVNSGMDRENRWSHLQSAAKAFETATQLAPLDYQNRLLWADALSQIGRYQQASTEAQEAIRLSPLQGYPYSVYASALSRSGRLEELQEAERLFRCFGVLPRPTSNEEEIKNLRERIQERQGE